MNLTSVLKAKATIQYSSYFTLAWYKTITSSPGGYLTHLLPVNNILSSISLKSVLAAFLAH